MKIYNPTSNEKLEHANKCVHAIEDTLNELYKIKGNKSKLLNYIFVYTDNCGAPQTADISIIDDELSNSLDTELNNDKHNEVRKMMKHGQDMILSSYVLNKN